MDFHFCADAWAARYPCDVTTVSPIELAATTMSATQIVDALSGHQFGLCTTTLRPCRQSCLPAAPGWYEFGLAPTRYSSWYWLINECSTCAVGCTCGALAQVELPYPVHNVTEVKIDGTPLVTGAYHVDDNKWLVLTNGSSWPACNDLTKADTQVGTWSVTAKYGQDPPQLGLDAVGEMTCELLKAYAGEDCRVPANVVSLVRQGVSIKYGDVAGSFTGGRTGLYVVDAFLESVNPNRLRRRPRVYDVDGVSARRART